MTEGASVSEEELVRMAREAVERAYAPYSRFRVGAVLLCMDDSTVFTGCNVENASYGLTMCAERVAVGAALAAGRRDLESIAIYADGPELPTPCGACRQVLAEFNPDMAVIVSNGNCSRTFRLSELLPHSFGPAALSGRQPMRRSPRGGGR